MSEWLSKFQQQYNIVVFRYARTSRGFQLETDRGTMLLQPLPSAYVHKAEFVYELNRTLQSSYLMLPIERTKEGGIISEINGVSFVLMAWPVAASRWIDYGWLGSSLAQFHCASAKLLSDIRLPFSEFGSWPQIWEMKYAQIKTFEQIALGRTGTSEEDPFDSFFLDNAEYLEQITSQSLTCLRESDYEQICAGAREFGRLSYVNFGFEKFVPTNEGRLFFTDPFALVEDTRARDIAQFVKADVRAYGWRPTYIQAFLSSYHAVSPIAPEEFQLMYALILLPGRLFKKLETLYYRPTTLGSDDLNIALFKAETDRLTAETAYVEMKRMETLIMEFPRFAQRGFGARIVC